MRSVRANIAVLAIGIVVALIWAEVIVRLSGLPIGARTEPISPFGGRYVPDSPFILEDEHTVRGRMNNVGFHDRRFAFDLPPSTYRIGFFGDSVTEARQVEADSTFASRLEDAARTSGNDLDCAAFGMSGSGADQSLFRCVHAMQQARFDEVIYVFYRNDFVDGWVESDKPPSWPFLKRDARGAYYFSGAFQDDRDPGRVRQLVRSLFKELTLPGFLSYRLSLLRTRARVGAGWRPIASSDSVNSLFALGDDVPSDWRPAQEHWKEVVRHWKRFCEARGAMFRILYIPAPTEVEDSTYAAVHFEGIPRRGLSAWMSGFCRGETIPFLDATDRFVRSQTGPGRELYWSHLNYRGHRVLSEYLLEELGAPAPAAPAQPRR